MYLRYSKPLKGKVAFFGLRSVDLNVVGWTSFIQHLSISLVVAISLSLFPMRILKLSFASLFNKLGIIDVGIEITPVKDFACEMSSSVSCLEQFVWDLEQRSVCNIDIPVLILGVAA